MAMMVRLVLASFLVLAAICNTALAGRGGYAVPGFGSATFSLADRSQRGGFRMVEDPIDPANRSRVYSFTISPAKCRGADCAQQSVRSALVQSPDAVQPKEAWYGWEIYFPRDFPFATRQSRGFQQFNEWKDQPQCGLASIALDNTYWVAGLRDTSLSWVMKRPTGKPAGRTGEDCETYFKTGIAEMSDIVGSWRRFELFARWSRKDDGRFLLYLDGKLVLDYKGKTCFSDCSRMNYHIFGNYLCCTPDTKAVANATVYYRFISRARSRDRLIWK